MSTESVSAMNNPINRILFEKPNIPELSQQYTVVDMHFHSAHSDGRNSIDEIAEHAEMMGIGVAITDHNEIQGAIEMAAHKKVLSIPGIEVTSREGAHILVYFNTIDNLSRFYHQDIAPHMGTDTMNSTSMDLETIIRCARHKHGITIFPHPFCGVYTGIANQHFEKERLASLLDQVDGVEVINSENLNKWNLKSALLGFNLNKAISGGSDGHSLYQLGKVVTYAACSDDRESFLSTLMRGHNRVMGKEIDILHKVQSNGIKLRSNLKNYPQLMEKNISYSRKVIHIKSKMLRDRVKTRLNDGIRKNASFWK